MKSQTAISSEKYFTSYDMGGWYRDGWYGGVRHSTPDERRAFAI